MNKLIITLLIATNSFSQVYDSKLIQIVDVLKEVETNRNPKSVGDNGRAYGVLQIHKICVDDVNRFYNTNFSHDEMFNEEKAELVAVLYLKKGVELFRKKYKKHPTEKQVVRMFNGNIYNGFKKDSTLKYYQRYLDFK